MRLIDTHQHLIYRDRFGYGWAKDVAPLAEGDFTVEDYETLAADRVAGTIFMEVDVDPGQYRDEARFVASLVGQGRMIGQIAACRPEEDGIEDWLEECRDLGVVGFRRVLHTQPDALSQGETFRRNLRAIGAAGYVFDICMRADQLGLAADLAEAAPDMTLVLDHCGVPDIAGGGFEAWRAGIDRIAALDHVSCKLSGITAYVGPDADPAEAIRPYVDHVFAAFGADRILWGSDWPVVDLGSGLPAWLGITEDILAGLSEDEAAAVAHRTAERVYGVGVP